MNLNLKINNTKVLMIIAIVVFILFVMPISFVLIKNTIYTNKTENSMTSNVSQPTISELEEQYSKNHDLYILKELINKYENQNKPDNNKLLNYYDELFINQKGYIGISYKISYANLLYKAGKKEQYYTFVNSLLNNNIIMENKEICKDNNIQRMTITKAIIDPIISSSLSTKEDFDFAFSKLNYYETIKFSFVKEFIDYYNIYSSLSKLYLRLGNKEISDYYKNKTLDMINDTYNNAKIYSYSELKQKLIDNLNNFLNSID